MTTTSLEIHEADGALEMHHMAMSTHLYFATVLVQKDLMLSTANIHGNRDPGLCKDASIETTGVL